MARAALTLSAAGAALAGAAALWAAAPAPVAAPAPPRRILSVNLCADQLILALADRRQIAGLTRNAVDPGMSAAADAARGLPLLGGSAEQILAIDPDLIVGMPATGSAPLAALPARNYALLDLELASDPGGIARTIRATAAATGHPARGEALVARMERELARIGRPGRGRVAAYYQRRGYMTGTGTLVDEMMTRVGLVNLAAKLGKPPLAPMSIEEMVAARPDFLIVEAATMRVADQGSEMLHHPALADIPRIVVPQAATVCAGPAYADAAASIARQITRHDARAQ